MAKREDKREPKQAFFREYIPLAFYQKGKTWLDCASGDGYMVADGFLRKGKGTRGLKSAYYICVDIDKEKLERLKEKGCKTLCVDLETVDIKKYIVKVDVILCIETLEHLEKNTAIRLVNDFISLLEKDGMMIISFPTQVSLEEKIGKCLNKHQPDVNELLRYKERFSDYIHTTLNKSTVLVFRGKK